jgi:hypothetical protein
MAVVETSADHAAPAAASDHAAAPYRAPEGGGADAGEREMRDLEELLSKLNPMAQEFVPPSLAAAHPVLPPPPLYAGYYPNGGPYPNGGAGFAPIASPGHRGVVAFPAPDGLGGRGRVRKTILTTLSVDLLGCGLLCL